MLAQCEGRQETDDPISVWLESDVWARIIVDTHLAIRWINSAALQVVRDTETFDIHSGKLHVVEHRWAGEFAMFIRSATSTESMLCLPQPRGAHMLCIARGLDTGGRERSVGLILRYTVRSPVLNGMAAEKAFHLTFAERRVLESLFSGLTAEQVGVELGVCTGTVRGHIRHIYDKLGVASREALFSKALPFFLPL